MIHLVHLIQFFTHHVHNSICIGAPLRGQPCQLFVRTWWLVRW